MDDPKPHHPARSLSLWDATSIIVGTIIGAAIFHVPQWVAGQVDSTALFLAIWVGGGLLALAGALCFAELTTAYNEDGGEYVYIREAYGRYLSFQYAWVTGWIMRPANMAAMAITFALFGRETAEGLQSLGVFVVAVSGVSLLAVLNLLGVRVGKWSQNLLTVCKVAGLLVVCLIGSLPTSLPNTSPPNTSLPQATLGQQPTRESAPATADPSLKESAAESAVELAAGSELNRPLDRSDGGSESKSARSWVVVVSGMLMALVFVMYSFGGWNDISFVAAEIRHPNRNLPRALFLGLAIVTVVYLYVNLVLVMNLGLSGLAAASNAPATMLQMKMEGLGWADWGGWVRGLLGVLVGVSCLGAINAMLITSPRIYYAAGQQHHLFQSFAQWNSAAQIPRMAIIAQWIATLVLLTACSGLTGPMGQWLPEAWQIFKSENPFDELVAVSSPFFWGFLTLVVFGQCRLRFTDPHRPRPIKTWAFPLPNLIFGTVSLFMLYRSADYAWSQQYFVSGGIVSAVFVLGLILGLYSRQPGTGTANS
jgi:basic amino acid/polyamine antiporter, APA family